MRNGERGPSKSTPIKDDDIVLIMDKDGWQDAVVEKAEKNGFRVKEHVLVRWYYDEGKTWKRKGQPQ